MLNMPIKPDVVNQPFNLYCPWSYTTVKDSRMHTISTKCFTFQLPNNRIYVPEGIISAMTTL